MINVTYYITNKKGVLCYLYRCQNADFASRAVYQVKTCILRNKWATVIIPEIVTSTSCNEQVLHIWFVHIILTLHTNFDMLHMCTIVRKHNTLSLPYITYAYSCTHT